ncbi:phage tail protein [Vibrio parahaemolyticus]|uniref:phage tail-collar fiber domain-containing protein n=1 Tax=Vibrio parahaemolyticus TaxID=670 RepID=UPI00235F2010|nr:phage tail protein [Vibrio parahaemolyticus]
MANSTDKSILTAAGKALLAQLNAEEKALVIDKMIFANVPNRPEYPQPDDVVPTEHIVHQEQVEQRGRLSADSVIYSSTLTSDVGPFDFNWTGAYCSEYGVLVTIDHHALTPKTADEPGVAGNTLVRSVVLEYKDIAEITNITVDASSWQYNATERMKKMDSDVAQSIIDQNGKDWFIEDGFLVTPSGSAYSIKAGAGYVSGNRVAMEFDRSVQVPNKPSFIYIDAHREGTPTGEQVTIFNFVVTAEEKDDYIDSSTGKDVKHFVCKIAQVLADGSVSMLRKKDKVSHYVDSINNLHTTRDAIEWRPKLKVTTKDALQLFSHTDEHGIKSYYLPNIDELPFVTGDSWKVGQFVLYDLATKQYVDESFLKQKDLWIAAGDIRGWGVGGEPLPSNDSYAKVKQCILDVIKRGGGDVILSVPFYTSKTINFSGGVHLKGIGATDCLNSLTTKTGTVVYSDTANPLFHALNQKDNPDWITSPDGAGDSPCSFKNISFFSNSATNRVGLKVGTESHSVRNIKIKGIENRGFNAIDIVKCYTLFMSDISVRGIGKTKDSFGIRFDGEVTSGYFNGAAIYDYDNGILINSGVFAGFAIRNIDFDGCNVPINVNGYISNPRLFENIATEGTQVSDIIFNHTGRAGIDGFSTVTGVSSDHRIRCTGSGETNLAAMHLNSMLFASGKRGLSVEGSGNCQVLDNTVNAEYAVRDSGAGDLILDGILFSEVGASGSANFGFSKQTEKAMTFSLGASDDERIIRLDFSRVTASNSMLMIHSTAWGNGRYHTEMIVRNRVGVTEKLTHIQMSPDTIATVSKFNDDIIELAFNDTNINHIATISCNGMCDMYRKDIG